MIRSWVCNASCYLLFLGWLIWSWLEEKSLKLRCIYFLEACEREFPYKHMFHSARFSGQSSTRPGSTSNKYRPGRCWWNKTLSWNKRSELRSRRCAVPDPSSLSTSQRIANVTYLAPKPVILWYEKSCKLSPNSDKIIVCRCVNCKATKVLQRKIAQFSFQSTTIRQEMWRWSKYIWSHH